MAEEPDKDQKTEAPTEKRLEDARKKGDIASAPEVRHAAMFTGLLVSIGWLAVYLFNNLAQKMAALWDNAETFSLTPDTAQSVMTLLFSTIAMTLLPLLATMVAFAIVGGLLQGRPALSWSRLAPKWSKLSPVSGAKRIFGMRAFVEFGKTLAKLIAVVTVGYIVVIPFVPGFSAMVGLDPVGIAALTHRIIITVFRAVALLVGAIAIFDLFYQRHSWLKKLRMSRQEVKDEFKDQEGDPHIKAKIRQIGMQRSRRRMMAAVPQASVVITNPTHFAVALKYDHGTMAAPVVVAKGTDEVALRIRSVATDAGVPLVENRPLARALHASAEIDRPIPVEHYAAVAEIISYVMKLAREN
ncbi:flagellar biosynthesis protein FlhB [Stakelama pacifica]|uniref:Flagellar biosynthetic protein FlhB n=1 Tax=Stakelama pacifica TaxID=517720 RepID=A0A4R6FIQ0_9SPHN|nr:flagellar biosynthesis protein FlhB [Stakelama pacifica]MAX01186.1 flagellar biosynthesis protein FlhB [Sphingomonas sp.]TDN81127.1 flagellar biosynthetic protein FlhB [Stakelama pacifica]GGO96835.1 flagellar biosynthesis protein FlhB [Stakelama pacifica]